MQKEFDIETRENRRFSGHQKSKRFFSECKIEASKHFMLKYMKKWNWDFTDLRDAIKNAYKIDKVGKKKYEAYARKNDSKKIIFVYYLEYDTIFIITGSEGSENLK